MVLGKRGYQEESLGLSRFMPSREGQAELVRNLFEPLLGACIIRSVAPRQSTSYPRQASQVALPPLGQLQYGGAGPGDRLRRLGPRATGAKEKRHYVANVSPKSL